MVVNSYTNQIALTVASNRHDRSVLARLMSGSVVSVKTRWRTCIYVNSLYKFGGWAGYETLGLSRAPMGQKLLQLS